MAEQSSTEAVATVSYHKGNNKSPLLSLSSRSHSSFTRMALVKAGNETKEKWRLLLCEKQSPLRRMYWGRGLELAPNLDLLKGLDDVAHLYIVVVLDIDTALET